MNVNIQGSGGVVCSRQNRGKFDPFLPSGFQQIHVRFSTVSPNNDQAEVDSLTRKG